MSKIRRGEHAQAAEQLPLPEDTYVTTFEVHDWDDWVRVIGWVEIAPPRHDGGSAERRAKVSLVMPRSSLNGLLKGLHLSMAHQFSIERHN